MLEPEFLTEKQLREEYNRNVNSNHFSIYKFVEEIELTPKDFNVFKVYSKGENWNTLLLLEQLVELFAYTLRSKLINKIQEHQYSHSKYSDYLSTFCYRLNIRNYESDMPVYVLTVYARMLEDEYVSRRVKEQYELLTQYFKDKQNNEEENKAIEDSEKALYLKLKEKYEKDFR